MSRLISIGRIAVFGAWWYPRRWHHAVSLGAEIEMEGPNIMGGRVDVLGFGFQWELNWS